MQLIMLGIACLILSVLSASLKAKNKNKVTKRNVEIHTIGDSKSAVQEMLRNAGFDEETVNMVGNKNVVRGSRTVTKRTVIKDGVTISEEVHTTSNGGTDQGITEFTSKLGNLAGRTVGSFLLLSKLGIKSTTSFSISFIISSEILCILASV